MAFAAPNAGIAVGSSVIVRTRTGGAVGWRRQQGGTTQRLRGIVFETPSRAVAVGDSGTVIRTTNAGALWIPGNAGTLANLNAVDCFENGLLLAAGNAGTLLKSPDGGATWAPVPVPAGARLRSLSLQTGGAGVVAGDSSVILRTTDYGATWSRDPITGFAFAGVHLTGENGYLVSDRLPLQRACFRTTDGGATWSRTTTPSGTPASVWMVHPETVFVGGTNGILQSGDSGSTWSTVSSSASGGVLCLAFSDRLHGAAGRVSGLLDFTSDGGLSWQTEPTGTSAALRALAFSEPDSLTIVGDSGTILRRAPLSLVQVREPVAPPLPDRASLAQNYPNPFNAISNFEIGISKCVWVDLTVFDLLGREVATLVNEVKEPGVYRVQWDASDFASGVYFYRLMAGSFVQIKRMMLVR